MSRLLLRVGGALLVGAVATASFTSSRAHSAGVVPPSYFDLNPLIRDFVDGFGVAPGTPLWLAYGSTAYPGQTGGQSDFGWRQDHALPGFGSGAYHNVAKAILSNSGHRPIFYVDEPHALRHGFGRPWDWCPQPGLDEPVTTGWIAPNGVVVVGHDLQHYSLKFLAALAAGPPESPYREIARGFLWAFAGQLGGMLRTPYFQTEIHSAREVGRGLDFVADAARYGFFDDDDADSIVAWIRDTVIPKIVEPGIAKVFWPTDASYHPVAELGLVPYWIPWQEAVCAPGMDRCARVLQETGDPTLIALGASLRYQATRIAQNVARVVTVDGAVPHAVSFADGAKQWTTDQYPLGVWCYRALRMAGAHAKADAVLARYRSDPYWWPFFVEPDGKFASTLPIAWMPAWK